MCRTAQAGWRSADHRLHARRCAAAPGKGGHGARVIGPDDVSFESRGKGANTRHIHPIAMEDKDVADSLLVTEVYTP